MTIVPRTYAIQATEVTVDDFVKVMGYTPPGAVNCSDCPVTNVSIFEALSYANRMSDAMGLNECYTLEGCSFELVDGSQAWTCVGASFAGPECDGIRLPSRAEWELASRGGGVMCFPDGSARADGCVPPEADDPARVARFCGNAVADYKPCPFDFSPEGPVCAGPSRVAGLPPNPFGLYDTNGNVVEYTQTEWVPLGRSATWIVERVDAKPEFIFDIDMDSSLADMGNHYFANARATCAYVEGPGAAVPPPEYRVQGFRLARTLAYSASADP